MHRLLATAVATAITLSGAAAAPYQVADHEMNVRNGPGTTHAILGVVPPHATVEVGACRPRDDHVKGAPFCHITWGGLEGWGSTLLMHPLPAAPPASPVAPAQLPLGSTYAQREAEWINYWQAAQIKGDPPSKSCSSITNACMYSINWQDSYGVTFVMNYFEKTAFFDAQRILCWWSRLTFPTRECQGVESGNTWDERYDGAKMERCI